MPEHTHSHTGTTHIVWAVRLDTGELLNVRDQADAERVKQTFDRRGAEVVHRHITFSDWVAEEAADA